MIVFNFCGEPGAGKSTAAAWFYSQLKQQGIEAELVGEAARNFIYAQGKSALFDNQFYVSGCQWELLYRLERCKVPVAVSDSPIMQGLLYADHLPYYPELKKILEVCNKQFPQTYNVWLRRSWAYDGNNRNQTEQEAKILAGRAKVLCHPIWMDIENDAAGLGAILANALTIIKN